MAVLTCRPRMQSKLAYLIRSNSSVCLPRVVLEYTQVVIEVGTPGIQRNLRTVFLVSEDSSQIVKNRCGSQNGGITITPCTVGIGNQAEVVGNVVTLRGRGGGN